tara:strand:- start:1195 stop:1575 length:381 start_codon:yes stop_codon:yes gene_type:complete
MFKTHRNALKASFSFSSVLLLLLLLIIRIIIILKKRIENFSPLFFVGVKNKTKAMTKSKKRKPPQEKDQKKIEFRPQGAPFPFISLSLFHHRHPRGGGLRERHIISTTSFNTYRTTWTSPRFSPST